MIDREQQYQAIVTDADLADAAWIANDILRRAFVEDDTVTVRTAAVPYHCDVRWDGEQWWIQFADVRGTVLGEENYGGWEPTILRLDDILAGC